MAEILGIVAGATQLLDLSARLVLASTQIYNSLKNVPEEIEALKKSTQDFYDLLWMISSDSDGPLNSHPNSLHVTHRIVSIFGDAMRESEELAIFLERLSNKSSSSVKRFWSSVAGLKERTEIADRGRRIESLKASIQMWYQHQSMMRLRAVEDQLSTITHSQLAAQSSLSLLTQQSARATGINQSLAMKLQSYHHAGKNMAEIAPQQQRRRSGRNKLCTCRPSVTVSHMSKWNLQLFLEKKITHATDCSRHTDTTTWSIGLRTFTPRIQAMLRLRSGGWSLSMIGKISPHNIVDPLRSPAFLAMSEAETKLRVFLESDEGYDHGMPAPEATTTATSNGLTVTVDEDFPLDPICQTHIESICVRLQSRLFQAFSSGTASPADRTPEGVTLLFQFLEFASRFIPYHEPLFDLMSSTLKILVPDGHGSNSYLDPSHSTPIEFVFQSAPLGKRSSKRRLQRLRLDGILISHGVDEISDQFRETLGDTSFHGIFNKHPCLLENYGQNPIHLAIVQKSEPKLRHLLEQGKVDFEIGRSLELSLANSWPAGLEILLNAGADTFTAIREAIVQERLQSIGLILDHGCPMFGQRKGLVDIAIDSRVSPNVILLLIEKLVERRQELLQLAMDHLPEAVIETSWCNYHLQPRPLLDYQAVEIYRQLKTHCIEVSDSLWPGPYTTIYHSPSIHKSGSLVTKLYDLGFHDIDKPDDDGKTPLISAIKGCGSRLNECPQLIHRYLDLGATLDPRSFFTHIFNQSMYFPTTIPTSLLLVGEQRLEDMLGAFRRLLHENTQKNDDCRCWCSTTGCTPVGVVLRRSSLSLIEDWRGLELLVRRRWLYLLPRHFPLGLELDQNHFTEICKLEIFDRLGMAHTCCHRLVWLGNHFPIACDERKELQEEDRSLKEVLDLYVELYLELLQQHQGSFESFWISWWFSIDHILPFDRPENSEDYFHPLHLPGIPNDELSSKGRAVTGYSPDITVLTSTVHLCATLLKPKALDIFLNQLNAASLLKAADERSGLRDRQRGTIYLD